jgi:RimJ/RimL family protein N-acetyltransferase
VESGSPATSRVELRDGRVALIAPLHPDDRRRYVQGMSRSSRESLYLRFMTPLQRLTEGQLRYLLAIDHRDHEALLAVDEDRGEAVAVARFVRSDATPEVAEAAMLVIDDWQGLGLGRALLELLGERARAVGITRFEATLMASNRRMMALLESLGSIHPVAREGPTITVEVPLAVEPSPKAR